MIQWKEIKVVLSKNEVFAWLIRGRCPPGVVNRIEGGVKPHLLLLLFVFKVFKLCWVEVQLSKIQRCRWCFHLDFSGEAWFHLISFNSSWTKLNTCIYSPLLKPQLCRAPCDITTGWCPVYHPPSHGSIRSLDHCRLGRWWPVCSHSGSRIA